MIEDIQKGNIQFVDEVNQYLLIEFLTATISAFTDSLFFSIQTKDTMPIIAHPERDHFILNNPDKLRETIEKGALAQLIVECYIGRFGEKFKNSVNN